jgi:hypothetical protein
LAECPRAAGTKGATWFALRLSSVQQIPNLHQIRQNCETCALGQNPCRRKPKEPFDAAAILGFGDSMPWEHVAGGAGDRLTAVQAR